ncbi:MAG TPA: phosphatase PAP2 family protein [Anaerolineales bacterium]|nr:phosphatase PAP2 family protein [Anaerolineales bacterium]
MVKPPEKHSTQNTNNPASPAEMVSPPVRRRRSTLFQLALILAVIVFALLTILVSTTPSFAIDLQITRAIQSIDSPLFAGMMRLVSWPGFLPQSIVIPALIALVFYLSGLKWEAVVSLLASVVSGLTNELIKDFIRRPRPAVDIVDVFRVLDSYSFPSGHVMFYTILFGFVWYSVYTLLRQSLQRSFFLCVFGFFILLVGISRIYLGQHWASDVLGAYLLGGLILVGVVSLHRWGKSRFWVRQPTATGSTTEE